MIAAFYDIIVRLVVTNFIPRKDLVFRGNTCGQLIYLIKGLGQRICM